MGVVLAEGALRGGGLRWLDEEWRAILRCERSLLTDEDRWRDEDEDEELCFEDGELLDGREIDALSGDDEVIPEGSYAKVEGEDEKKEKKERTRRRGRKEKEEVRANQETKKWR